MAFKYLRSKGGVPHPNTEDVLIKNSAVITIGDVVRSYVAGYGEVAVAARPVLGVVVGVVDKNGLPVDPDAGSLDTYTVASDNQTVAMKRMQVITSKDAVFSASQDGTVGATNDSELRGCTMDLVNEHTLDESTALRNASGQFYCLGADPEDATRILCSIMEHEDDGTIAYS